MRNYTIHTGGGLGDIILSYLRGYQGWSLYRSIKQDNPNCKIRLILTCKNPVAKTLFENDPYIDIVDSYPRENPMYYIPKEIWNSFPEKQRILWKDPNKYLGNDILIDQTETLFKNLPRQIPKSLYLNKEDKKQIEEIKKLGSYIVLHPFAAGKKRTTPATLFYYKLAQELERLDYNAVVLGANNKAIKEHKREYFVEDFPYTGHNIINLVNKTNLRVSFELVRHAKIFIGTSSCFFCAAAVANNPPALGYVPPSFNTVMERRMAAWHLESTKTKWLVANKDSCYKLLNYTMEFIWNNL